MSEPRERDSNDERVKRSRAWLARYDAIVDDRAAFLAALEASPPVDLMVPNGADARARVAASLAARGIASKPADFSPHHLRVETALGAGSLPEVVLGLAYPQGVSSAVAPLSLGPRPGERVLDLCAAPGGKTALLDAIAQRGARIIANDRSPGRAGVLVQALSRLAIARALVVVHDGAAFPSPGADGHFDAIQVDAPCTGEGTFRIPSPRYDPRGDEGLVSASAVQRRILQRALDLLAPGGRLVYATCSYAPEENEAVIASVLATRDDIEIAPLPAVIPGQPALHSWRGTVFPEAMERGRRVFPHHTGSWGFFVALLRKDPASTRIARIKASPAAPRWDDDPEAKRVALDYLGARFGVAAAHLAHGAIRQRGRDLWLLEPAPNGRGVDLERLHVVAPGLRLVHHGPRGPRVSTAGLRWLGDAITERVIDLDMPSMLALLAEDHGPAPPGAPAGQVAIRVEGRVVSGGLVAGERLELELPRAWR